MPRHEILEAARQAAGLSTDALWWAYVTLGGTGSPLDVAGYLSGAARPNNGQYDRLAQALNERFTDLGQDQRVPYADSLGGV